MFFLDDKETQARRIFPSLGKRTLQNLDTRISAVSTKKTFLETQNCLIHIWHNAKIQNTFTLY